MAEHGTQFHNSIGKDHRRNMAEIERERERERDRDR